jgi:putative hydroxymethylpyrimidine transporter CytX
MVEKMEKKTGLLSNSLLWFGASVSIAEIMTGALIAPLGMKTGSIAILLGHAIGCLLFYFAGMIGAKTGMGSMESVSISFGRHGGKVFSALNILQLLGWTAVMIIGASRALSVIIDPLLGFEGGVIYSLIIGALIIVWLLVGIENLGRLNVLAVGALFVLLIVLSTLVFGRQPVAFSGGSMSFGGAVELSAAMPISWLPLVSDYVIKARRPRSATAVSAITYFAGSSWMYIIGLAAAVFIGNADIAIILVAAGLGGAGAAIVLLATVTTTFLDAYSAGASFVNISKKVSIKAAGTAATVIGTILAVAVSMEKYEAFLYMIGSVFTPMIAILITDFFILKNDSRQKSLNLKNMAVWLIGFLAYRILLGLDLSVGSALPAMIITSILTIIADKGAKLCLKK